MACCTTHIYHYSHFTVSFNFGTRDKNDDYTNIEYIHIYITILIIERLHGYLLFTHSTNIYVVYLKLVQNNHKIIILNGWWKEERMVSNTCTLDCLAAVEIFYTHVDRVASWEQQPNWKIIQMKMLMATARHPVWSACMYVCVWQLAILNLNVHILCSIVHISSNRRAPAARNR